MLVLDCFNVLSVVSLVSQGVALLTAHLRA